jgi:hypothetical protein
MTRFQGGSGTSRLTTSGVSLPACRIRRSSSPTARVKVSCTRRAAGSITPRRRIDEQDRRRAVQPAHSVHRERGVRVRRPERPLVDDRSRHGAVGRGQPQLDPGRREVHDGGRGIRGREPLGRARLERRPLPRRDGQEYHLSAVGQGRLAPELEVCRPVGIWVGVIRQWTPVKAIVGQVGPGAQQEGHPLVGRRRPEGGVGQHQVAGNGERQRLSGARRRQEGAIPQQRLGTAEEQRQGLPRRGDTGDLDRPGLPEGGGVKGLRFKGIESPPLRVRHLPKPIGDRTGSGALDGDRRRQLRAQIRGHQRRRRRFVEDPIVDSLDVVGVASPPSLEDSATQVTASDPGRPKRGTLVWSLRGASGALLASSLTFGALAWNARSDFQAASTQVAAAQANDRFKLDSTLAWTFLGSAVVCAAVSYLVDDRR